MKCGLQVPDEAPDPNPNRYDGDTSEIGQDVDAHDLRPVLRLNPHLDFPIHGEPPQLAVRFLLIPNVLYQWVSCYSAKYTLRSPRCQYPLADFFAACRLSRCGGRATGTPAVFPAPPERPRLPRSLLAEGVLRPHAGRREAPDSTWEDEILRFAHPDVHARRHSDRGRAIRWLQPTCRARSEVRRAIPGAVHLNCGSQRRSASNISSTIERVRRRSSTAMVSGS